MMSESNGAVAANEEMDSLAEQLGTANTVVLPPLDTSRPLPLHDGSGGADAIEGGNEDHIKKELMDDADRPRFEDSLSERFFWYGVGLFVALIGIILAALIGAGVIGLGDGTRTLHIAVRWIAFPIVLGFSLLVGVACSLMMVRECMAVRVQRENAMLEEEMQEGAVTASQGYLRIDDADASTNNDLK